MDFLISCYKLATFLVRLLDAPNGQGQGNRGECMGAHTLLSRLLPPSLGDGARGGEAGVVQQDLELAVASSSVDVSEFGIRNLARTVLEKIKGVVATVGDGAGAQLLDVALGDGRGKVGHHCVVVGLQEAHEVLSDLVLASPHVLDGGVDGSEELSDIRVVERDGVVDGSRLDGGDPAVSRLLNFLDRNGHFGGSREQTFDGRTDAGDRDGGGSEVGLLEAEAGAGGPVAGRSEDARHGNAWR